MSTISHWLYLCTEILGTMVDIRRLNLTCCSLTSWQFFSTCSGLLAPTMTLLTRSCCNSQEREATGILNPAASHTDCRSLMVWNENKKSLVDILTMKAATKSYCNERNVWEGWGKRIETQVVFGLVISEIPHGHSFPHENGLKLGHISPYMES